MEGLVCRYPYHKIVPLMLILIAFTFILQALNILDTALASMLWPVFLIIAGLTKLSGRACTC